MGRAVAVNGPFAAAIDIHVDGIRVRNSFPEHVVEKAMDAADIRVVLEGHLCLEPQADAVLAHLSGIKRCGVVRCFDRDLPVIGCLDAESVKVAANRRRVRVRHVGVDEVLPIDDVPCINSFH